MTSTKKKMCQMTIGVVSLGFAAAVSTVIAQDNNSHLTDIQLRASSSGNYIIRSTYGCPNGQWCNAELSWDGTNSHPMASVEFGDRVEWKFEPVSGKANHYIIRSTYGCPNNQWCNAELSWDRTKLHPMASVEFGDRVEWKVESVPGKANHYIIRSTYGCPNYRWCNAELSWDGTKSHPMASVEFNDRVEWEIIPSVTNPNQTDTGCVEIKALIDNDTITKCPVGTVMVGIAGGFGHNSEYNKPHRFRCCPPSDKKAKEEALAKLAAALKAQKEAEAKLAAQFEVFAKKNSISGGVGMETGLEVTKGQYLLITVDEEDTWSAGGGPRTSNADGLGNPLGHNFGNFNKAGGSFLYGSLVASLDGGKTFFLVGTKWFGTASNDGVLSFYYWDSNQGDNGGSVIANVQIDSDSLASCQSDKQSLQQSLDENQARLAAEKTAKEEALAKLAAALKAQKEAEAKLLLKTTAYLGCFKDQGAVGGTKGRDLNGLLWSEPQMTTEKCLQHCQSKGYDYAGTQNTAQCFCGNTYGRSGKANNCNRPCKGNPNQMCGGRWANSVYDLSFDEQAQCQSDKQSLQQSLDENQALLAAEKTAKEEALAKLAACETSPIFNGTWTLYDPQTPPIPMVLREAGNNRVVGSYTSDGGQVQFTKEGLKLVGYWGEGTSQEDCRETKQVNQKNTRYWGKMVLEFNENLSTYTGKYSYCNANPTTTWYGQKID